LQLDSSYCPYAEQEKFAELRVANSRIGSGIPKDESVPPGRIAQVAAGHAHGDLSFRVGHVQSFNAIDLAGSTSRPWFAAP